MITYINACLHICHCFPFFQCFEYGRTDGRKVQMITRSNIEEVYIYIYIYIYVSASVPRPRRGVLQCFSVPGFLSLEAKGFLFLEGHRPPPGSRMSRLPRGRRTDGRTDGRTEGRTDGRTDGRTEIPTDTLNDIAGLEGSASMGLRSLVIGSIERTVGWTDGQSDGLSDGLSGHIIQARWRVCRRQLDIYIYIYICSHCFMNKTIVFAQYTFNENDIQRKRTWSFVLL